MSMVTPATVRANLWKLRLAMIGTFAVVTAVATLLLLALFTWLGLPFFSLTGILVFVLFVHVLQWLFGPYLIDLVYRVREAPREMYPELYEMVENLARRSGLKKTPKVMISSISIPNAFAYGSPIAGYRVAVTRGILETVPAGELEAVLAHEVGHLKHKDIVVMLMVSMIPAIIYYIGYVLYISGWFGGYARDRDERSTALYLFAIGLALMFVSFLFNLFVFYISRLREYYADAHAALSVKDGATKLQRALVRIMYSTGALRIRKGSYSQFKMFFIADPDKPLGWRYRARDIDELVEEVKRQKPSLLEELFSTHPHPSKRLRNLDKYKLAYTYTLY